MVAAVLRQPQAAERHRKGEKEDGGGRRLGGVEGRVLAILDRTAPDSVAVRLFTGENEDRLVGPNGSGKPGLYAADGCRVSRGQGINALSRALSLALRAAFRGKWQPRGGRPRHHRRHRPGTPGPATWTRMRGTRRRPLVASDDLGQPGSSRRRSSPSATPPPRPSRRRAAPPAADSPAPPCAQRHRPGSASSISASDRSSASVPSLPAAPPPLPGFRVLGDYWSLASPAPYLRCGLSIGTRSFESREMAQHAGCRLRASWSSSQYAAHSTGRPFQTPPRHLGLHLLASHSFLRPLICGGIAWAGYCPPDRSSAVASPGRDTLPPTAHLRWHRLGGILLPPDRSSAAASPGRDTPPPRQLICGGIAWAGYSFPRPLICGGIAWAGYSFPPTAHLRRHRLGGILLPPDRSSAAASPGRDTPPPRQLICGGIAWAGCSFPPTAHLRWHHLGGILLPPDRSSAVASPGRDTPSPDRSSAVASPGRDTLSLQVMRTAAARSTSPSPSSRSPVHG
ncbi:hypothetical protein MTO96_045693 [Rhipicephalus appendiculatus]